MARYTQPEKPVRYVIDGNIASGKTTFIRLLKEQSPNLLFQEEPIRIWTNFFGKNYLVNINRYTCVFCHPNA